MVAVGLIALQEKGRNISPRLLLCGHRHELIDGPVLVAAAVGGKSHDPARLQHARQPRPAVVARHEGQIEAAPAAHGCMVRQRARIERQRDHPVGLVRKQGRVGARAGHDDLRIGEARSRLLDERRQHDRIAEQEVMGDQEAAHTARPLPLSGQQEAGRGVRHRVELRPEAARHARRAAARATLRVSRAAARVPPAGSRRNDSARRAIARPRRGSVPHRRLSRSHCASSSPARSSCSQRASGGLKPRFLRRNRPSSRHAAHSGSSASFAGRVKRSRAGMASICR